MKKLIMAGIAMMTIAISSCDETTSYMGNSLTSAIDKFSISTDTFNVYTHSMMADSVLARSSYSYLGRIKDPETGSYLTGNYMSQFNILENASNGIFCPKDQVVNHDDEGLVIADSCYIRIFVQAYMGDSLTAMKMNITELAKPVQEDRQYYTNFDPDKEGYLRKDGGIRKSVMFSLSNLTLSDSVRAINQSKDYFENITFPLNETYTDKDGNSYNNYGTYLLRKYYDHPEYFKNSLSFRNNVCPGFYFQIVDGLGLMAEIERTQLVVYYRYKNGSDTYTSMATFNGTDEVLQTTNFTSYRESLNRLVADESCTYLKSPDGIFTEVELPIDDIKITTKADGSIIDHRNDTITQAKIVFHRMNDMSDLSDDILEEPEYLLMVMRDSLYTFFENRDLPNNVTSYLATYSLSKNSYTFNNISGLIGQMYANKGKTENWNKVVLVPVQVTTSASSSSSTTTTTVASVSNAMRTMSVKLVGGRQNQHAPVQISVVYSGAQ